MSSDFPADRRPRLHAGRLLVFCLGVGATIFAVTLIESWVIKGHALTADPSSTFASAVAITNVVVIMVGVALLRPWIWGIKK